MSFSLVDVTVESIDVVVVESIDDVDDILVELTILS